MSELDLILLIVIPSTLVLGAFIFFVSGIYKVKKDQAMLIEKAGEFYKAPVRSR